MLHWLRTPRFLGAKQKSLSGERLLVSEYSFQNDLRKIIFLCFEIGIDGNNLQNGFQRFLNVFQHGVLVSAVEVMSACEQVGARKSFVTESCAVRAAADRHNNRLYAHALHCRFGVFHKVDMRLDHLPLPYLSLRYCTAFVNKSFLAWNFL